MTVKIAIIGCGAVGSIHAAKLREYPGVELTSLYTPNLERASAFASTHGIKHIGETLADALAKADLAIVSSPSALHFQQARECLEAGVHTLVELPPCAEAAQAEELAELARQRSVRLGCAHTSRYLRPYAYIKENLRKGEIGEIQEASYVRYHQLRARSWTDNALHHHAAHPLDLFIDWCGGLEPKGCVALPDVANARAVSILGKLPGGGPVVITASYASHLPHTRMLVIGKKHTVETDGFSYVRSDLAKLEFHGNEQEVYERAIRDQDTEFLRACQGKNAFVGWDETIKLVRTVNQFQILCES